MQTRFLPPSFQEKRSQSGHKAKAITSSSASYGASVSSLNLPKTLWEKWRKSNACRLRERSQVVASADCSNLQYLPSLHFRPGRLPVDVMRIPPEVSSTKRGGSQDVWTSVQPCRLMGYRVVRSFRASRESNLGLNAIALEVKRGRQVEYVKTMYGIMGRISITASGPFSEFAARSSKYKIFCP